MFILSRKRGSFIEDSNVITLFDANGSKISNVRDFRDKIHFDFNDTGKTHTITIAALTEHGASFERKDAWDPLETKHKTKEKLAEVWADSLKKS